MQVWLKAQKEISKPQQKISDDTQEPQAKQLSNHRVHPARRSGAALRASGQVRAHRRTD
jgi:hypothetical protein